VLWLVPVGLSTVKVIEGDWKERHMASEGRITRISSRDVPEPPPGTWSNCLVVNGVAYVAGMIARGNDGKIVAGEEYEQAKVIFTKIRNLVEAAGGAMADVVKVTIFVTDITHREEVWRARREFFAGDMPTSTLVEVAALAEPSVKVEIEAVAHIGAGMR
jgi:enamine deaminase RidA (YjgF/YER057c/UK114 family)